MKRFMKWCLILTGLLLAVGMGLHTAGAAMGGRYESDAYFARRWGDFADRWDGISGHWRYLGGLLGTPQSKDSGAIDETINAIEVDVDCGDVRLSQGENFAVYMEWNLRGFTMDYKVEDGVLKVESESKSGFLNGVSGWKNEVTITVPSLAGLKKVDLNTNLGDIDVTASCVVGDLQLTTNLGDIDVDAPITATGADLNTDLGDVECKGVLAGELNVKTNLGDADVDLPWEKDRYLWELETSLGELKMDGEKQSGDVGGAHKLRGGTGSNRVTVRSDLGDVGVSFAREDMSRYNNHAFDHLYERVDN